ncbi:hypothetical protein AQUCO_11000011v1 [Aquilegia coerulea]|uniref:Agglutinin domain-containing protein n=1 Tax=Aquilegia coerulea TaxID=218851 RepID=A0A2G5C2T5_AQUCA|nr:hypothetical protein AQUCO_11000011v1 [Aquilegia coerulea]
MPYSTEAKNKGYFRHIRCCSNNKYLVNNIDKETCRVVAGAEKPEEDTSKSYCTLFQLENHESNVVIRHVPLGRFACFWQAAHPFFGGMYLASELPNDKDKSHLYTLLNWEKLVVFPKRVAFKGDDKKYIRLMHFRTGFFEPPDNEATRKLLSFQQFAEEERNDQAEYEVTTVGDGYVRIKSLANGKFWIRQSANWIIAASDKETSSDPDTLFEPIKIAGTTNVVVLRNLGNNLFCRRLWQSSRNINCLSAASPNINEPLAVLVVEELVDSRQIYDIDFDLSRRRIYDESVISLDERTAENPTDETGRTLKVTQKYTDTKTTSWNTSKSLSFGAKATFKIAKIPVVKWGLDIELSVDHTTTNEWGGSNTSGVEKEATFEVSVPPRTKRTVFVIARQAACEVPFSYTQTDTLPNGKDVTERKYDGIYNGVNILKIDYTTKDEILRKE